MAIFLLGFAPASEEKRLAVYSAQTSYTIPVSDHAGQEYVSLTDLFDPFGRATLTHKGKRWKLRLQTPLGSTIDAEFDYGGDTAKIRGKKVHLAHAFWADGERGYVPIESTPVLMLQFTRQSTSLRENSRRLFVGDVSTTYTAEMAKGTPNKVILHFSAPVNPMIATEPGRVLLRFSNAPLIPGTTSSQTFDSPLIQSAKFSEDNGASEIAIATAAPTHATFSDGGRTITLTAMAPVAQSAPVPAAAPSASVQPQVTNVQAGTPTAQISSAPPFMVIIDPAHGGNDPGATLGDGFLEKDVTLAIARRIRTDLQQRGISALLLRDGDSTISLDQRAIIANSSRGAVYVCVHATTFGTGVRLYSASLPADPQARKHGFLPWDTAQATYLDTSHTLEASLVTEFDSRQIHSIPLEAGLRPLRNIAKPAIAIEVAEPVNLPEDVKEGLSSVAYQQAVAAAVASGIADVRGAIEVRR